MPEQVPSSRPSPKDRAIALGLSLGSAIQTSLPEKFGLVGKSTHAAYVPVRWRAATVSAADIAFETFSRATPNYPEIAPGATAGRLPRNYGQVAVMAIDREQMDRRLQVGDGVSVPAVAYALGSAVMYGTGLGEKRLLGLESPDAETYQVAMRIGAEPLHASIGSAIVPGGALRGLYTPLEDIIRGEIMPEVELPAHIPLV